ACLLLKLDTNKFGCLSLALHEEALYKHDSLLLLKQNSKKYCPKLEPCIKNGKYSIFKNCILRNDNNNPFLSVGGKSTFLKSIGVVVLLAQMGCFVPCSFAQIYPVDNILVRIGAGDNQSEGISTFMNEMINMKEILDVASQRSLILVDELGRGTSTQDGFGLAWAISEHIATRLMAPCVIATHFHELCSLSDIHSSSFNMHCTALIQDQRFLLLYKIKHGKSSQSYGIQIAELAQFPTEVISKAKSYLRDFEQEPSECNEIYSRVKSRRNV
ncbi:hypothetical protein TCAL_12582, partial [Tigriopus californicus]